MLSQARKSICFIFRRAQIAARSQGCLVQPDTCHQNDHGRRAGRHRRCAERERKHGRRPGHAANRGRREQSEDRTGQSDGSRPYGDQDYLNPDGGSGVTVSALDLATAALGIAQGGHQVQFNLVTGVPGLASVTATLAIGSARPTRHGLPSPTRTTSSCAPRRRAFISMRKSHPPAACLRVVASIDVPIYIELASAQAKLADIQCGTGPDDNQVTLSVSPSIGQAAIAGLDVAALDDFTTPETLGDAEPCQHRPASGEGQRRHPARWRHLAECDLRRQRESPRAR